MESSPLLVDSLIIKLGIQRITAERVVMTDSYLRNGYTIFDISERLGLTVSTIKRYERIIDGQTI